MTGLDNTGGFYFASYSVSLWKEWWNVARVTIVTRFER